MEKSKKFWVYDTCYAEAKKYKNYTDFRKNSEKAYKVAMKNGWISEYVWLERKVKPNGYWTYDKCFEEAKKYTHSSAMEQGNASAYFIAVKNDWVKDYTWFKRPVVWNKKWTKEQVLELAKGYEAKAEFRRDHNDAYMAAVRMGWDNELVWAKSYAPPKKWTYETCLEESKKYKTKGNFRKMSLSAYQISCRNKWIGDFFPD